jgi:hypothetical protein
MMNICIPTASFIIGYDRFTALSVEGGVERRIVNQRCTLPVLPQGEKILCP